ncbi:MAG: hypothetical protein SFV55_25520 [Haliscomenobacter sp.]|nr:hypothetical protein [Haliscomenobacter sp.]MDX2071818.1 hypothetical protein [Haliscomenobacter sp.]
MAIEYFFFSGFNEQRQDVVIGKGFFKIPILDRNHIAHLISFETTIDLLIK